MVDKFGPLTKKQPPNPDINWTGISGKSYPFWIRDISSEFDDEDGVYIFARQMQGGWHAVYIGEGNLRDRTRDETHRKCAILKGATHIHAQTQSNQVERHKAETDLLAGNQEAYAPIGCNQKLHG